jgi:hypothetical protein
MSKGKSGFVQKVDGEGFTLKPGSRVPFRFCCCGDQGGGCFLVHDFFGTINSDGEIEVTVYRNDQETERVRTLADYQRSNLQPSRPIVDHWRTSARETFITDSEDPMRNARRFDDDDDFEIVTGYDGKPARILKDGRSVHVSLAMRDSLRRSDAEAARIAEAVAITKTAMRGSGTPSDPYILGQWPVTDAYAANKPGYRYADSGTTEETEHHVTRRRRKTVYRDPEGREAGTAETGDAMNETEKAYSEMLDHLHNGWKTPPVNFDATATSSRKPEEAAITRSLREIPPPGGWFPIEAVGQVCDINGVRGTVVREGEHGVCRPGPVVGPTRADAAPRVDTMDAATAQRIRDEAYAEYCSELENAWR